MKAIGYIRVSTEDQAKEGISLDAQKEKIELHCKLKDLELIEIISDEGISAGSLKRPGMKKLLSLVDSGKCDVIVVYKLDRIFRSTIDSLETSQDFKKKGVEIHSIQENLDTDSAIGRFFFTMLSALAQMEREIIGERTQMALTHLKENGKVYGNIPYGKMRVGDDLIDNLKEKNIMNLAKDIYKDMGSYRAVAKVLNVKGIRTRSGKSWYAQQVKNIVG